MRLLLVRSALLPIEDAREGCCCWLLEGDGWVWREPQLISAYTSRVPIGEEKEKNLAVVR
jgi:hypothetical protein